MVLGSADPHITLSQGSAEGVLSFPHSYDEEDFHNLFLFLNKIITKDKVKQVQCHPCQSFHKLSKKNVKIIVMIVEIFKVFKS